MNLVTIPLPAPNVRGLAVIDLAPFMSGQISEVLGFHSLRGESGVVVVSRVGVCLSPSSGARQAVAFRTIGNQGPIRLTLDIETSAGTVYHFTTEVIVPVPVGVISYVFLGTTLTYTLPVNGDPVGTRIGIKDTLGNAESVPRIIFGNMDDRSSTTLNQNYAAREFVWNGSGWSIF